MTDAIRQLHSIGAPADSINKAVDRAKSALAQGAVRGWFKSQHDRYGAAEALYSGNVPDKELSGLLNSMAPAERSQLLNRIIDDSSKLVAIGNQQREAGRAQLKERDEGILRNVFFDPRLSLEERSANLDVIRRSPHLSVEAIKAAEKFVRDGARDTGLDVEADQLKLERAVRNDELKTDVQIIDYVARNNLQVSTNSIRERIIPLLESKRDKLFSNALDWGESELGYDKSAAASGIAIFADKADKAAKYRAEMLDWRRRNPDGDVWAYAKTVTDRLKSQGNAQASASLPVLVESYRGALAKKDPASIAAAKTALTQTMISAGMVDPLTASRSDFDPMNIIDQPKAK